MYNNGLLEYCPLKKGIIAKHLPYLSFPECKKLIEAFIFKDRDKYDKLVVNHFHKTGCYSSTNYTYEKIESKLQNFKEIYQNLMLKFPDDHFRNDVVNILNIIISKDELVGNVFNSIDHISIRVSILLHLKEGLKIASYENFFREEYHCDLKYEKDVDGKWRITGAKEKYGMPIIFFDYYYNSNLSHITSSEIFWSCISLKYIPQNTFVVFVFVVLLVIVCTILTFMISNPFFMALVVWGVSFLVASLVGKK